jgi:hypothetical protein
MDLSATLLSTTHEEDYVCLFEFGCITKPLLMIPFYIWKNLVKKIEEQKPAEKRKQIKGLNPLCPKCHEIITYEVDKSSTQSPKIYFECDCGWRLVDDIELTL